jgi:hypothetical protein
MKKLLLVLMVLFTVTLIGCNDNETTTEDTRYQALEQRIDELEQELDNCIGYIREVEIILNERIEIAYGGFVGINAYGYESYVVIEVKGVEYEAIPVENYVYVMNEIVILVKFNGVYYGIPIMETYQ